MEIAHTLGRMESNQDQMKSAVMGNGQPGLKQRVENLEEQKNKVMGGLAVVGVLAAGLWGFLEYIFHYVKSVKS